MQTRPKGVTLFAMLCFANAGVSVFAVFLVFGVHSPVIIILLSAAITGTVGYGLWTLKYWGYILTMICVVGGLSSAGLALFNDMTPSGLVVNLLRVAALVVVMRYFWRPSVRGAFS